MEKSSQGSWQETYFTDPSLFKVYQKLNTVGADCQYVAFLCSILKFGDLLSKVAIAKRKGIVWAKKEVASLPLPVSLEQASTFLRLYYFTGINQIPPPGPEPKWSRDVNSLWAAQAGIMYMNALYQSSLILVTRFLHHP